MRSRSRRSPAPLSESLNPRVKTMSQPIENKTFRRPVENPLEGGAVGRRSGAGVQHGVQQPAQTGAVDPAIAQTVDYVWFEARFARLGERLRALEASLTGISESVAQHAPPEQPLASREYFSVPEFAELVGRGEYTVREWCRLERIHAEKCDSGRGDAKNWKIPASELGRYRDHGLLPQRGLR